MLCTVTYMYISFVSCDIVLLHGVHQCPGCLLHNIATARHIVMGCWCLQGTFKIHSEIAKEVATAAPYKDC